MEGMVDKDGGEPVSRGQLILGLVGLSLLALLCISVFDAVGLLVEIGVTGFLRTLPGKVVLASLSALAGFFVWAWKTNEESQVRRYEELRRQRLAAVWAAVSALHITPRDQWKDSGMRRALVFWALKKSLEHWDKLPVTASTDAEDRFLAALLEEAKP